jgi:hypothetical protein
MAKISEKKMAKMIFEKMNGELKEMQQLIRELDGGLADILDDVYQRFLKGNATPQEAANVVAFIRRELMSRA